MAGMASVSFTDDMLTMAPGLRPSFTWRSIWRAQACSIMKDPLRLMPMTRSNSASVTSRKSVFAETAALLTRMSTAPNFRTVKATSALTSLAFDTSHVL